MTTFLSPKRDSFPSYCFQAGNHMTLVRLKDGKFIAIDAVDPQGVADGQKYKGELKDES